jgi:hypothetical protein
VFVPNPVSRKSRALTLCFTKLTAKNSFGKDTFLEKFNCRHSAAKVVFHSEEKICPNMAQSRLMFVTYREI